jgi:chaperonin GroES
MLKPLNDYIVMQKVKTEKQTASGIILTGEHKDTPDYAIVKAIGSGAMVDGKRVLPTVQVGDKVVFKKYSATDVKIQEEEYLIIQEKDILAVIE